MEKKKDKRHDLSIKILYKTVYSNEHAAFGIMLEETLRKVGRAVVTLNGIRFKSNVV